jgi:hypothetical protein
MRRRAGCAVAADVWYSTVSKVLRQKDKYLYPDDGSRSPIKRAKGKFPDIERALANWARNHQRQRLPLSDDIIRDKARFFATTVGSHECHTKVNSSVWLEKFKQKNQLLGAKASKGATAAESDGARNPESQSGSETPNGISPVSPGPMHPGSPDLSQDELKSESPTSYIDFANYRHTYSQSATSLISSYSDNTFMSTFSGDLRSPTSPFFSPESSCGPSPCIPSPQSRLPALASAASIRPRRGTFPTISPDQSYMSLPDAAEPAAAKYLQPPMAAPALESPLEEMEEPLGDMEAGTLRPSHHATSTNSPNLSQTPVSSMAPPPPPTSTASPQVGGPSGGLSPPGTPSQDDARRALEVLMTFFKHQPSGVDPQEYITMGKLMEKLKLQSSSLPGGMHAMGVGERGDGGLPINRKRSIHSL